MTDCQETRVKPKKSTSKQIKICSTKKKKTGTILRIAKKNVQHE